jgi:kanamycin kinase
MSESRDLPVFWSGRPSPGSVSVPTAVASVAGGRPAVPVWVNEAGGLTFEVGDGAERCFVKWAPAGSDELDLAPEADRMEWACRFHPVPRPLARGQDADGSWLVTTPVAGDSAVTARWKGEPALAVTAIGEGLRAMHDSLPAAGCPFSWARRSASPPPAARPRPAGRISRRGTRAIGGSRRWPGHTDLGRLGIADRWADLAIATWSTGWNYGPGWERLLLDAYGVEPDPERTRYYRLLWDLG